MAKPVSARREFWLSHVRQWRKQGGTMKAYAQANELSVDNFYAAKSAYAREENKDAPHVTLLPVQTAPMPSVEPIRVSLANGVRIEVPITVTAQQWRTLLDALGPGG